MKLDISAWCLHVGWFGSLFLLSAAFCPFHPGGGYNQLMTMMISNSPSQKRQREGDGNGLRGWVVGAWFITRMPLKWNGNFWQLHSPSASNNAHSFRLIWQTELFSLPIKTICAPTSTLDWFVVAAAAPKSKDQMGIAEDANCPSFALP